MFRPHIHISSAMLFVISSAASFVAMSLIAYGSMYVFLGHDRDAMFYAELIYLPCLALFLVLGIAIGLCASHHCFKWLLRRHERSDAPRDVPKATAAER